MVIYKKNRGIYHYEKKTVTIWLNLMVILSNKIMQIVNYLWCSVNGERVIPIYAVGVRLFWSLSIGNYIGCRNFCVVGWIGIPNRLMDFKRGAPMVNLFDLPWIFPYPFQVRSNFVVVIPNNKCDNNLNCFPQLTYKL